MADSARGGRAARWGKTLRDAIGFARDVLWLLGWGGRRLGVALRGNPTGSGARGCFGCAGSLLVMLGAALLWRKRWRNR